ncbi:MAG: hypothetical protein II290_11030 [Oscillospiraceae bacterium]|nr:hypothetical protein [Oscillospiraceae bacterium]
MMKRTVSLLLALAMILGCVPGFQSVSAATQSAYAPYANIEYGYSDTVKCGTVRYVSQVSSDSYFYPSYWPTGNFGYYVVVVGQISSGVYQILDPWQRALTKMTVSGSSATYSTYGSTIYDTIDQVHQWYDASATVDYISTCTDYASYCKVQSTQSTPINSQPCSVESNGSVTLETVPAGTTFTAVGMYKNTFGNYWYKVTTSGGKTGYLYGGHSKVVELLHSDVKISGATAPNGQVSGTGFVVNGTISSTYSDISSAALYVCNGFGTNGTVAMSASDTVGGKSYTLRSSNIDGNTRFSSLATGNYTYVTTGIIPYSLGKYCEGKAAASGDAQQVFAQATAVYGYYAKGYFASIA